jgi:hypothetical protein
LRLATLLAAWLPALAFAGHVELSATPPWQNVDGSPANLTGAHYEWQKGCGVPGRYELGTESSPGPSLKLEGLPDSGRCYFRVAVVQANGVSSAFSDEAIFDFGLQAQVPSTPTAGPTVTFVPAPTTPTPSWSRGYNFRATLAYVTDPAGTVPVLGERYPTARGDGWEAAIDTRNRSQAVAAPLAGNAHLASTDPLTSSAYRITLPAPGRYRARLAAGDMGYPNAAFWEIRDGTTVLASQAYASVPQGQFRDATGVLRPSAANWVSSNAPLELLFATRDFRLVIKRPPSGAAVIATLILEALP